MSDINRKCSVHEISERGRIVYEILHLYDNVDCVNLYHGDGALPPHPIIRDALNKMEKKIELWDETHKSDMDIELRRYRVADSIVVPELYEAILNDFAKSMPSDFDRKDAVVHIGGGITQLVAALFHYFRQSHEKIIMYAPTYTSFVASACSLGGDSIYLAESFSDGKITPEHIEKALDKYTDTKALFLINPNNPTGQYFTKDELRRIASLSIKRDLIIIVDEVFHKLVFDTEEEFVSMASIEIDHKLMFERTVTLRSVSKDHGLAAIRTGYAIGPRTLMKKFQIDWFTFITTFSVDDLAQRVTCAALSHTPIEYYEAQRNLLRNHRDIVKVLAEEINLKIGYQVLKPEPVSAGMFQLIDFSSLKNHRYQETTLDTDIALFTALLQEGKGGVAFLPASCGGYNPVDMKLRLTLSSSEKDIRLGMKRLYDFILKLYR